MSAEARKGDERMRAGVIERPTFGSDVINILVILLVTPTQQFCVEGRQVAVLRQDRAAERGGREDQRRGHGQIDKRGIVIDSTSATRNPGCAQFLASGAAECRHQGPHRTSRGARPIWQEWAEKRSTVIAIVSKDGSTDGQGRCRTAETRAWAMKRRPCCSRCARMPHDDEPEASACSVALSEPRHFEKLIVEVEADERDEGDDVDLEPVAKVCLDQTVMGLLQRSWMIFACAYWRGLRRAGSPISTSRAQKRSAPDGRKHVGASSRSTRSASRCRSVSACPILFQHGALRARGRRPCRRFCALDGVDAVEGQRDASLSR